MKFDPHACLQAALWADDAPDLLACMIKGQMTVINCKGNGMEEPVMR